MFHCVKVQVVRADASSNLEQKHISSSSFIQFYCFETDAIWVKCCYNTNQAHEPYSVQLFTASA